MNSTSLAVIQPEELDTIQRVARLLAVSTYFDGKGDNPQAIAMLATKIMAGRELGFGPFASANNIHIIKGKPCIGANLMAASVKSNPRYDYRVKELTSEKCVIEFFEREGDKKVSVGISEFTMKDAQAMELTGKDNWIKAPRNMLFARAMSNGMRWYCPDTFSGNAVYVPEELGAEVDGDGNVIDTTYTVTKPNAEIDYGMGKQIAQNAPQASQTGKSATEDRLAALGQERMAIEMSDLEYNHRKRELAPIDAEIAKLEQPNPVGADNLADLWDETSDAAMKRQSPPHQRLWGIGLAVVGKADWDMARGWITRQWSKTVDAQNVRTSTSELTEDEKTLLGDYINANASAIQKAWPQQKGKMVKDAAAKEAQAQPSAGVVSVA